jgi:hypothetical protein
VSEVDKRTEENKKENIDPDNVKTYGNDYVKENMVGQSSIKEYA